MAENGPTVFVHACRLGAEGIVSKKVDGTYQSGPCRVWIKVCNPASIAVQRERSEIWNRWLSVRPSALRSAFSMVWLPMRVAAIRRRHRAVFSSSSLSFDHALNARRKAERTADPAMKADFLEMEKRWLALAESYGLRGQGLAGNLREAGAAGKHGSAMLEDEHPFGAIGGPLTLAKPVANAEAS
jgi:hypothetical protein